MFPVVDVHTHLFFRLRDNRVELDDFVSVMDRNRIAVCVSLDGRLDAWLDSHHQFLHDAYPNRFAVMAHLNWVGNGDIRDPATWDSNRPGWGDRMADAIREADAKGQIVGLKIFKRLGLGHRHADGSLVAVDDPMLDPIWNVCGELGLPVLMHTADPAAFFEPIDQYNERWEELIRHPDWSFHGDEFPSRDELFDQRCRMWSRHPDTNFIAAHVGNDPEDLDRVEGWLRDHPNVVVELASRISELGRQPRRARRFILDHSDRVLFGTDGPWPEARLRAYWRFLETADESFDYSEKQPPPQGHWRIDGVDLPPEVLRKVYHENAVRLMPRLAAMIDAAFPEQMDAAYAEGVDE